MLHTMVERGSNDNKSHIIDNSITITTDVASFIAVFFFTAKVNDNNS